MVAGDVGTSADLVRERPGHLRATALQGVVGGFAARVVPEQAAQAIAAGLTVSAAEDTDDAT